MVEVEEAKREFNYACEKIKSAFEHLERLRAEGAVPGYVVDEVGEARKYLCKELSIPKSVIAEVVKRQRCWDSVDVYKELTGEK